MVVVMVGVARKTANMALGAPSYPTDGLGRRSQGCKYMAKISLDSTNTYPLWEDNFSVAGFAKPAGP